MLHRAWAGVLFITLAASIGISSNVQARDSDTEPQPVIIRAEIYNDANGNNSQDKDEPGLPGVVVTYTERQANGTIVSFTRQTNAQGQIVRNADACPCDWRFRSGGNTVSGMASPGTAEIQVIIASRRPRQ